MKRIVLLALIGGCIDFQSSIEETAPPNEAERLFAEEVFPMLQANCVVCHSGAPDQSIGFLAGESWQEIRATLLASDVVSSEPSGAPLLTKGAHSGPHLTSEQAALLVRWLEAEGL
jgi:mono/diheme cytochrome c family protein